MSDAFNAACKEAERAEQAVVKAHEELAKHYEKEAEMAAKRSERGGIPNGVRERGIPERINQTALDAMMAPGPLGDAIVLMLLMFPRRPAPPSSGGIGSAGPEEKNVGGYIPAQQRRGRFPIKRGPGVHGVLMRRLSCKSLFAR